MYSIFILLISILLHPPSSPHFTKTSITADSDGSAIFHWTESKLTNDSQILYNLRPAQLDTFYCVTGQPGSYQISGSPILFGEGHGYYYGYGLTYPAAQGQISTSLYVYTFEGNPKSPTCPTGQTRVLACVSYRGSSIIDQTNSVTHGFPNAVVNILPEVNAQSPLGCQ